MDFETGLLISAAAAVAGFVLILRYSGEVMPDAINSDAALQIRGAAQAGKWRWPSDMHDHIPMKARLKDVGVLLLAVAQRLMGDFSSFRPLVAVCAAACASSIVLMYLVGTQLWDAPIALFVTLMFATSIWNFQVILQAGYQMVAAVPFLGAILALLSVNRTDALDASLLHLIAGLCTGLMIFASASSRKYFPLLFVAFLYGIWPTLNFDSTSGLDSHDVLNSGYLYAGIAILAIATVLALVGSLCFGLIVRSVYEGTAPAIVTRNFMHAKATKSLEDYLGARSLYLRSVAKLLIYLYVGVGLLLLLPNDGRFYSAAMWVAAGLILVFIVFFMPDPVKNLRGFISYWRIAKVLPHFPFYRENFAREGIPYPKRISAGGATWFPRFLWRFAPFHLGAAVAGLVFLLIDSLMADTAVSGPQILLVAFLGVSPILWGELSASPQVASTYHPALPALMVPVGFGANSLVSLATPPLAWTVLVVFLVLCAFWNLRILRKDIWPSRMAAGRLYRELKKRGISRFASYKTSYNNALVAPMLDVAGEEFEVSWIDTLNEVRTGWVVVPGVTRYAPNLQSVKDVIRNGDFTADPVLNALLESREIDRIAATRLQTVGSSPYWIHVSDIYSYLDLIHRRVAEKDRWRGHAWLINIEAVRNSESYKLHVGSFPREENGQRASL